MPLQGFAHNSKPSQRYPMGGPRSGAESPDYTPNVATSHGETPAFSLCEFGVVEVAVAVAAVVVAVLGAAADAVVAAVSVAVLISGCWLGGCGFDCGHDCGCDYLAAAAWSSRASLRTQRSQNMMMSLCIGGPRPEATSAEYTLNV